MLNDSNCDERCWKLSPSDFAFLWEECKCCFYLKVVNDFQRPRPVMPKIFTVIDSHMKQHFMGKRTETVATAMPKGVIESSEKWVQSIPIKLPGHRHTCFIRGKFDTIVKFDDGTYGVIDFKTSQTKEPHIPLYARQLHAYAYALENAARNGFSRRPISKLGLLVFEPEMFVAGQKGSASLSGGLSWIEIERDDRTFLEFLSNVLSILEQPSPPLDFQTCEWCGYRDTASRLKGEKADLSELLKKSINLTELK